MREALEQVVTGLRKLHRKRAGRPIGFGVTPDEDFCPDCSTWSFHLSSAPPAAPAEE